MPWSPSSVNDWLACPRLWWLKRQGVIGRARDETAMEMGSSFHALMASYWDSDEAFSYAMVDADSLIVKAVYKVMDQEHAALKENGIVGVEVNLDGDDAEAARHGRYPGTCDLITDNGAGLTVWDYKCKRSMEAKYADGELRQTDRSWQLLQYAWFIQKKYQRPVTKKGKLLVAFGPSLKVWRISYPVTQEALDKWHKQATRVWALMDECEKLESADDVWQDERSCERFGWNWRCEYHETCWV